MASFAEKVAAITAIMGGAKTTSPPVARLEEKRPEKKAKARPVPIPKPDAPSVRYDPLGGRRVSYHTVDRAKTAALTPPSLSKPAPGHCKLPSPRKFARFRRFPHMSLRGPRGC